MDIPKQETSKDGKTIVEGVVAEALPNTLFRVDLNGPEPQQILAYLGGKMRMNRIRVLIGDRVTVEMDQYGGKGRIVKRG